MIQYDTGTVVSDLIYFILFPLRVWVSYPVGPILSGQSEGFGFLPAGTSHVFGGLALSYGNFRSCLMGWPAE